MIRMSTNPPVNHFDRGKPFYPLVMNFLAALHGWQNLLARGIGRMTPQDDDQAVEAIESAGLVGEPTPGVESLAELRRAARLPAVIKPLGLASRGQGKPINIDHDQLADEAVGEHHYLVPQTIRAGEQLLIVAWETTSAFRTHDQLWEFLRHCRNAAAHGGRFTLRHGEPRRPAVWRELEITRDLEQSRLFDGPTRSYDGVERGLLAIGDAIALLWDLERAYPDMTGSPD